MDMLTRMAKELLIIDEDFPMRVNLKRYKATPQDFTLHTFEQMWGSTAGGFDEGVISGAAMTTQRVYVFIPREPNTEDCIVYFGDRFAYKVPLSDKFVKDVKNENVAPMSGYKKYMKGE